MCDSFTPFLVIFLSASYFRLFLAIMNILVFRPFQFQKKEKTNSGYKHNSKVSHGIFNLTFCMLQHISSEVTFTKSDEI